MNNQSFQWNAWLRSKMGLASLALLAAAAFYLITEHTTHILGLLPFAIVLLCPLMMLFMHGGRGDAPAQHSDNHSTHTSRSSQFIEVQAHHMEERK